MSVSNEEEKQLIQLFRDVKQLCDDTPFMFDMRRDFYATAMTEDSNYRFTFGQDFIKKQPKNGQPETIINLNEVDKNTTIEQSSSGNSSKSMEVNSYFYGLAKMAKSFAAERGVTNVSAKWIYSQWYHETGGFTSELQASNHNLGGLTQTTPNDSPQPDGNCYYMEFDTFEDYARYFGHYLGYYKEDGIDGATTLYEYLVALKHGGYFGDSLDNYYGNCKYIFENTNFGD